MVKNFGGGNKSKGFARKNITKKDTSLRTSEDEAEVYAQVTKIFGGTMCQVVSTDGKGLLCHIRGKFRGRGKRDNFIANGTWLLVGLRSWETEPTPGKLLNCDVIEVYNDVDKNKLKNNITGVNWSLFIANDTKMIGCDVDRSESDTGVTFSNEQTQYYQDLIESQVSAVASGKEPINITDNVQISIDDI
jgi:initiation factor 1A